MTADSPFWATERELDSLYLRLDDPKSIVLLIRNDPVYPPLVKVLAQTWPLYHTALDTHLTWWLDNFKGSSLHLTSSPELWQQIWALFSSMTPLPVTQLPRAIALHRTLWQIYYSSLAKCTAWYTSPTFALKVALGPLRAPAWGAQDTFIFEHLSQDLVLKSFPALTRYSDGVIRSAIHATARRPDSSALLSKLLANSPRRLCLLIFEQLSTLREHSK